MKEGQQKQFDKEKEKHGQNACEDARICISTASRTFQLCWSCTRSWFYSDTIVSCFVKNYEVLG